MASQDWKWYIEYSTPHHGYMYAIQNYVFSGETPFSKSILWILLPMGGLDSGWQNSITQFDEHIYHEALIHPAVIFHSSPAGFWSWAAGRRRLAGALQIPVYREMIMVDIDRQVVDLCRQHLAAWHQSSLMTPGLPFCSRMPGYINETNQQFDIIYSDLSSRIQTGPSYRLFTRQF